MAKTRRTKTNKSPGRPYRNSRAFIANQGDKVTTIGFRGRTEVLRVGGKAIRRVADAVQTPAKGVGDRKPKGIFIGRQYTGVARSKPYPYRSKKRGGSDLRLVPGLMAKVAKAVKRVVVNDAAE
jgi:hypothetical protein